MADPEHLSILRKGCAEWNRWRRGRPSVEPNLQDHRFSFLALVSINLEGANLAGATLQSSNFRGANLREANLSFARVFDSDMSSAKLQGATLAAAEFRAVDLSDANLESAMAHASFIDTRLRRANFQFSDVQLAQFRHVDCGQATFAGAKFGRTTLVRCELASARGLGETAHTGPSSIDYHTLMNAPHLDAYFLRGCGLPAKWIQELPDLCRTDDVLPSCFISYATDDLAIAEKLHADLQKAGVNCWFAPEDMVAGTKLRDAFFAEIGARDKLLVILSRNSLKSSWVEEEVSSALEQERRRRGTILIPISIDSAFASASQGWAEALRARFVQDFSRWDDAASYGKSFTRLMRAFDS